MGFQEILRKSSQGLRENHRVRAMDSEAITDTNLAMSHKKFSGPTNKTNSCFEF